jgi:two-component system CheB/CheR fusion protein
MQGELLEELLPPSLVVDSNDDVVEVIGDVGQWCWVAPGPPSVKVVALVREELRTTVRTLLLRLRHGDRPAVDAEVSAGEDRVVVTARRLSGRHPDFAVITFTPAPVAADGGEATTGAEESTDVEVVTRELATTQAALQATVEDLSASNEELRALNEELQASSEEAQSANEELQASNEELSTLNQELQVRTAALLQSNRDLENIQTSVSAGLILVDQELRITRFTAPAVRVFALIDDDIGRELASIPTTMDIADLVPALRDAVQAGKSRLLNASGQGGDYLIAIQPYLGGQARVLGAVVVVTDVTEWASARRRVEFALQQLNAVTDAMADTVWQRDGAGELLLLSRGVEQMFGLRRDKVLQDQGLLRAAVHPDDRERVALAVSGAESTWDLRYRIVRPDGTVRWVQETAKPMTDGAGGGLLISGSIRDVTAQTVDEEIARRRRALLEAFFALGRLSVLLLDADGKILRANTAFADLTGLGSSSLVGMPLTAIVPTFTAEHLRLDGPGNVHKGHRLIDQDGSPHWVSLEAAPLAGLEHPEVDPGPLPIDQAGFLITIADLTPSLTATEELRNQVRFDAQTGVLARAEFQRRVDQELARTRRSDKTFGVLWIDLDGFKEVNDTQGHQSGDLVLASVAQRLSDCVRGQDNVGRLGGDEFAVIVTDTEGTEGIEVACERVLAAVREPISDRESMLYVTASIGVAVAPEDGTDSDTLLHNADTAMYAAKGLGGDTRAYFQPLMNERAKERGRLRRELGDAIRSKAFMMHYQPMVDVVTGQAVGVEALIRWQREDEIVPAADFIDDARLTGQLRAVGRLGQDAIDQDLAVFASTPALNDLVVSVNLAVEELEDRDLIGRVMRWTPPGGMKRMAVEVTEQSLLPEAGLARESLALFQRLGAAVTIDDFGTGYSNLAILSQLRPQIIKIDRSLLSGSANDPTARPLLRASIEMVHALSARCVVEGVETKEQAELIRELGADIGQGYYYARPMPLEELPTWIAQRQDAGSK